MPNSTFQLKQFSIQQGHSAMKLGTDALVLGAWVANMEINPQHILDIGTGTGILSLMLAQAYPESYIDAIEIDKGAALDAQQNFASSPWKEHLKLYQEDALAFLPNKKYDLIISNPPFFASTGIGSSSQQRQLARQEQPQGLGLNSLIHKAISWLKPSGRLCLIFPYEREETLRQSATEALMFLDKLCIFYSQPNSPTRLLSCLCCINPSHTYTPCTNSQLLQRDDSGKYSLAYQHLLAPYLLDDALKK